MDFNIGNLSSCVMGAVVQLATTALSLVEETASAVLGAIAGLTNVTEDGEVDEDELEGFLNNLSKVVVGAIIATLGYRSAGIKNYDEEDSEEEDDSEEVAVDGNELDNYLYDYIWVFGKKIQIGKKLYSSSQRSDLPKEIKWEAGGYVYYYILQEQPFSEGVFGGEPVYGQEITLNDGKVINTKVYGYVLIYTNEPPQPEIKDGTLPFLPGKGIIGEVESKVGETYTPSQTNSGAITDPVQLRRTYEIDGNKIEMQSGHAYNRIHSGGSVQDIGTMDEVEKAVLKDFTNKLNNNEINLPHSGTVDIEVNGKQLSYRAVWVDKLKSFSINYFPKK
ncbi:hypothetical protein [Clostridium beijerinckii]|uniref:Uncharacterized protein n=1 Tax=Clostridium beijerinckii TaxID=1520 RepID=A0AAX0B0V5_CLOBE|nr:hypothetical protein [Clostridium beijerinckii]NRT88864.1 hypothetical protein [Clostridium beijerinckii]NYC74319.1 hypothetical protein [Clostridium beijerinckii]